jgi:hypothetical protein
MSRILTVANPVSFVVTPLRYRDGMTSTKVGPGQFQVEYKGEKYELQRMLSMGWSSGRRLYPTHRVPVTGGGPFVRVTCGDRVVDVPEPAAIRYREPSEEELLEIIMAAL